MNHKMTQVGVAWKKTTQNGRAFLSVVITNPTGQDIRLSIWPNSFKEKDGQPDYIVYKPADERPAGQAQRRADTPDAFPSDAAESPAPPADEEIPF